MALSFLKNNLPNMFAMTHVMVVFVLTATLLSLMSVEGGRGQLQVKGRKCCLDDVFEKVID